MSLLGRKLPPTLIPVDDGDQSQAASQPRRPDIRSWVVRRRPADLPGHGGALVSAAPTGTAATPASAVR